MKIGPGYAAQRLAMFATKLERSTEPADLVRAECIRVILAQRSRLLTEKFGPERDFSRPPSADEDASTRPATLPGIDQNGAQP